MLKRINRANLKKTIYYLKRNGLKNTYYAILERLAVSRQPLYRFIPPDESELDRQQKDCRTWESCFTISIVVPCYRTDPGHLLKMLESVRLQTYPRWELILADATEDDSVKRVQASLPDSRIRYVHLTENAGIAENTNRGVELASGEYIGLLDHDDLLTPDALYCMAVAIAQGKQIKKEPVLLYSDEDKCNSESTVFYEPNFKEDFNLDLLLGNNFVCHFMLMERSLIRELMLRKEYDGAQDYDLVLRAANQLAGQEDRIVHVPNVLYHWRCHTSSTAENPQSKRYAYDAGRRAVQDFAERRGWQAKVVDTAHLGFYRLEYQNNIFEIREDLGAIGGPLIHKGKISGGRMAEDGHVYYEGLNCHFSGYLHRASLHQNAEALDIRNICVRKEAWVLFQDVVGVPWQTLPGQEIFDVTVLPEKSDFKALSLTLSQALHKAGYKLLYLPEKKREL